MFKAPLVSRICVALADEISRAVAARRMTGDDVARSLFAEATPIDNLLAKGIVPADGRGRGSFLAATLGGTPEKWRDFCRKSPDVGSRLDAAALNRENAYRGVSIADFLVGAFLSLWTFKLEPTERYDARYTVSASLDGVEPGDHEAAVASLASIGITPVGLKSEGAELKQRDRVATATLAVDELTDQASAEIIVLPADRPEREPPQGPAEVVQFPLSRHGGHLGEVLMPELPADDGAVVVEVVRAGGLARKPFIPPRAETVRRRVPDACRPAPWWPAAAVPVVGWRPRNATAELEAGLAKWDERQAS